MSPIYDALGLTVGVLQNMQPYEEKRAAYAADITYGTNSEFGFDYLRDNMATSLEEKVQHGGRIGEDGKPIAMHNFAIVDEVDNILIDEARTPLIISGAPEQAADLYEQLRQARAADDRRARSPRAWTRSAKKEFVADFDYEFDEKHKTVSVTEQGVAKAERSSASTTSTAPRTARSSTTCIQALKAESLYKRDVDYAVDRRRGEDHRRVHRPHPRRPPLVGGPAPGGRGEGGRARPGGEPDARDDHAAELLPHVRQARGHDGHGAHRGDRVHEDLQARRRADPDQPADGPRRPERPDLQDQGRQVARGRRARSQARHDKGQPVLVGTISVEVSELLSERLRKRGIPHTVLNAKPEHAEREGEIIAEAGRPGAVTIATNMAGRGVDIKLGGNAEHLTQLELAKLGLQPGDPDYDERFADVLPELEARVEEDREKVARGRRPVHLRHRAPRVAPDRQPAARPRRPPGRPRRVALLPLRRGRPRAPVRRRPDLPHPRPPRPDRRGGRGGADRGEDALEADRERPAQGRGAELPHPQARARVRRRHEPAARGRLPRTATRCSRAATWATPRASEIAEVDRPPGRRVHARRLRRGLGPRRPVGRSSTRSSTSTSARRDRPRRRSTARSSSGCSPRTRSSSTTSARQELGEELMRALERYLLLQIIDQRWREHLYDMDYLREGIHLRGFAQIEPLVAYKNEAFTLFQRPDEHHLVGLRAHDLQRRGRGRGRRTATAPAQLRRRRRARGGARHAHVLRRHARRPAERATARPRRAYGYAEADGPRSSRCRSSSSAASTRTSRSAATTRAGAGRARSSRSATAPSAPLDSADYGRTGHDVARSGVPVRSGRVARRHLAAAPARLATRPTSSLLVAVGLAFVAAILLVRFAGRLSARDLQLVLMLGTVLITVCVIYGGDSASAYALMYVWVALYAAYVLQRRARPPCRPWSPRRACAAGFLRQNDTHAPSVHWLMGAGTIVVAGAPDGEPHATRCALHQADLATVAEMANGLADRSDFARPDMREPARVGARGRRGAARARRRRRRDAGRRAGRQPRDRSRSSSASPPSRRSASPSASRAHSSSSIMGATAGSRGSVAGLRAADRPRRPLGRRAGGRLHAPAAGGARSAPSRPRSLFATEASVAMERAERQAIARAAPRDRHQRQHRPGPDGGEVRDRPGPRRARACARSTTRCAARAS